MTPENEAKAKKLMMRMRQDVSKLFKKYGAEAELLSESGAPHTAVIGCLQIALCNASAAYLLGNGINGNEAFYTITATLNDSQHHWARAITGGNPTQGKSHAN